MVELEDRRVSAKPLETRHIFLDTQVFRTLRHNPANRLMQLLAERIAEHRIALHTTDVTLSEVRRQIGELVLAKQRDFVKVTDRDFRQWQQAAPEIMPKGGFDFNVEALSEELFAQFRKFMHGKCKAQVHRAASMAANPIFERYFSRQPPFDSDDSKEFPDAFVVASLAEWCGKHTTQMYVVTRDAAMLRAAASYGLLCMQDLREVLARAAAELGTEAESAADLALNQPNFDFSFEEFVRSQMGDVSFDYRGDLPGGEAYQGELVNLDQIDNWSVVNLNERRVGIILDVTMTVRVEIEYEDMSCAVHDSEDDAWYGVENRSDHIEDEVSAQFFVELNRNSGEVEDGKILTENLKVYGPTDWM